MLKSKRKLIDIRLLPMAHLAIKIEAINNFHVAYNLCITLARSRASHWVDCLSKRAAIVCICICWSYYTTFIKKFSKRLAHQI